MMCVYVCVCVIQGDHSASLAADNFYYYYYFYYNDDDIIILFTFITKHHYSTMQWKRERKQNAASVHIRSAGDREYKGHAFLSAIFTRPDDNETRRKIVFLVDKRRTWSP